MEKFTYKNIDIFLNKDTRYKSTVVNFTFFYPFKKELRSAYLMLSSMMRTCNEYYPEKEDFAYYLEDLYSTRFGGSSTFNYHVGLFHLKVDFINQQFIDDDTPHAAEAVKVMVDSILHPHLTSEDLEIEKNQIRTAIENTYNNKSAYAFDRFMKTMFKNEEFQYDNYGTLEELEEVNIDVINECYKTIINSPMVIYVVGNEDEASIKEILDKLDLSSFKPYHYDESYEFFDKTIVEVKETNMVTEIQDVNQAIMILGFRSNIRPDTKNAAGLGFFTSMFGEYFHSTLFQEVREKNSLAYSINSTNVVSKGCMYVSAKVAKENVDRVIGIIKTEFKKYQDGIIDDNVYNLTMSTRVNELLAYFDSPSFESNNYLRTIQGLPIHDKDYYMNRLLSVTKEDIMLAAQELKLDTIYILTGDNDEED